MSSFFCWVLVVVFIVVFSMGWVFGLEEGKKSTMRDACKNGVATKEIVGETVVYRWIETHKIDYNAE